MKISLRNSNIGVFCALIFFLLCTQSIEAQIDPVPDVIENRALVMHALPPSNYFKIPEIKFDPDSGDDFLQIDFFVEYANYKIGNDSVRMRSYVYKDVPFGMDQLSEGPTIRIKRNDRFAINLFNNLPLNGDRDYLGFLNKNFASLLDRDSLSAEIKEAMIKATKPKRKKFKGITADNLEFASMEVVRRGEEWVVFGHSKCECPPEERGTCEKDTIFYNIEKRMNLNPRVEALRIYSRHEHDDTNHNEPHGFNVTNFHTHGFHVSPLQDDILRRLDPGYSTYYTYDLKDHTPGTMWYHPHIHGSTALQVASGMSGVIIIEDDPQVLASFPALRDASKPEHEKVMVFNQLLYDKPTGELHDFRALELVKKPPAGTTINGIVKPIIDIERGEVQRWRMLHSGYTTNIGLYYDESVDVRQIAVDGITFNRARPIKSSHLSTGNRMDILIKVADDFVGVPGTKIPIYSLDYLPECEYFPESDQCADMSQADNKHIIAYLRIGSDPMIPSMTFPNRLPGPGIGHEDIRPGQLVNRDTPRKTVFEIFAAEPRTNPVVFEYGVNGKVFDGNVISEKPLMGTREAWIFEAKNFEHPFHIHINPFQIVEFGGVKLKTPMWKDVALVREWNRNGYGTWNGKLPISVKQGGNVETLSSGSALAYTYYQRYWGGFVLHCHILDHEDRGMMQRVNIVNHIGDSDLTPTEKRKARDVGFD